MVLDAQGLPGTVVTVELDGTWLDPVPVELGPIRFPRGGGVLLDAYPWPDFIPSGRFPADGAALRLATACAARVLVACPPSVSPGRALLALEVGRLLVDLRAAAGVGVAPVVTSADRPRCVWESGSLIVPHPVVVHTRGGAQLRVVWELTETRHRTASLATLAPPPDARRSTDRPRSVPAGQSRSWSRVSAVRTRAVQVSS